LESNPAVEQPRLPGVFLTNVVRCNPPGNRNPTTAEIANCSAYLNQELAQVEPQIVVTLGNFAARWAFQSLLQDKPPAGIRALHGRTWQVGAVTLLCLVHPARASNKQMAQAESVLRDLLA
jgi:DNA polymerase